MPEFNLLDVQSNICRDVSARLQNKDINRAEALKFGWAYFDGPREQGYGGYVYDGRWQAVAQKIIHRYQLKPGMRVLDIGCAKGFLLKDLLDALPGLELYGLDISEYAIEHAMLEIRDRIIQGNCDHLPWPDGYFDAVIAVNVIHNLEPEGCAQSLREIKRVSKKGQAFVQVDAYRNDEELELFEAWMLTAKTYHKPEGWLQLFEEVGYTGDYYWTILQIDSSWIKV